jgi:MFS superfamily sulfate permease-like transporter
VVAGGAIQAILFVVILATLRFVRLMARPKIEVLGKVAGMPGYHSLERHPEATALPGLLLLRFNAPIVFFNAPYFKRELLEMAKTAPSALRWIVLDMLPITMIDATGLETTQQLADELESRGIGLAAAGRRTEWLLWAESRKFQVEVEKVKIFPTLNSAIRACSGGEETASGS